MAGADDDDFVVRPGAPRHHGQRRQQRFVAQVLRAAGVRRFGVRKGGAGRGRGLSAIRTAPRSGANGRRAVVKVRLVRMSVSSPAATAAHLRYIERAGVGEHGEPGMAYGPNTDRADLGDFQERCGGDRHHFRIILAPEDGARLGDLKAFTRQFMRTIEADLGTQTEWVAVDHWDTDNAHTHIVLRGVDDRARDLVIAREYIAHGLRQRAGELATLWLGPRTQREIEATVQREIGQGRWTRLDQSLQHLQENDTVRLPAPVLRASPLRGRMQTLTALGLAEPAGADRWRMQRDWPTTLRRLGERGDIIRQLQRAMGSAREFAIFDAERAPQTVTGRVAGKGLVDELTDRGWLALDGLDGRVHYVALPHGQALEDYPQGAIVEVRAGGARAIDTAIAKAARDGIYRSGSDLETEKLRTRRLEALRVAGLVERIDAQHWRIPADLPEGARAFDARKLGGAAVSLRSHLTIEQQSRALGATWLDAQLIAQTEPPPSGFGAAVREALTARTQFLEEQGLARRSGQRLLLASDLLAKLREREVTAVASKLAKETGLPHRVLHDGQRVQGIYRRSLQLASGRFALLDDGNGFALVPWRPVVEPHLGRSVAATITGSLISWEFGRERGIAR